MWRFMLYGPISCAYGVALESFFDKPWIDYANYMLLICILFELMIRQKEIL